MSDAKFTVRMEVKGSREVQRALKALPKKVANKVIREAVRAAMKPVLAAAKSNAPFDEGELRRSLVLRVSKSRKKGVIAMSVFTDPRRFEGPPHAAAVEFGTSDQEAQPFMQETFDQTGEAAMNDAVKRIAAGIEHQVRLLYGGGNG